MCGIFGIAAAYGRTPSTDESTAIALRDELTHRGPDDAGLWMHENVVLTHRRLSVIDPGPRGRQPMLGDPDAAAGSDSEATSSAPPLPRLVLVYNGELYNDRELRRELRAMGVSFATQCDTETVLKALQAWGVDALAKLRGMFALACWDTRAKRLLLARDPLGVKPLYYAADAHEVVFASEPGPIVRTPRLSPKPNAAMISAYLTTIRTVIGPSTLFEGVHAVQPGEVILAHCDGPEVRVESASFWRFPAEITEPISEEVADQWTRGAVTDSVVRHLRSDVPTCALLSGGLDSTITTAIARNHVDALRTYAAGAPSEGDDATPGDLEFAREVAAALGTAHAEAHVSRELFAARWPELIQRLGVPLSTPNEVAIHAVAERLRADGCVVTISGEGADELFAGYEGPMAAAARYLQRRAAGEEADVSPAAFELRANAWVTPEAKPAVIAQDVWQSIGQDEALREVYAQQFAAAADEAGGPTLAAHLRFHRRINLTGLLQRLDTATMQASVEGRTPLADAWIAKLAEALPMEHKFGMGAADDGSDAQTKLTLRRAFAGVVPESVRTRRKASFPLPFQGWMEDLAPRLRTSRLARAMFTEAAIKTVAQQPGQAWSLAWPMINVAIWGDRWW
jgi:asparagine synthase (glutamine-hydrolysing)